MKKKLIIQNLLKIISSKNLLHNKDKMIKYNNDWRGFYKNKSICVVFPTNKNQISKLLNFFYNNKIKIVPQGGNTSLTGSSVPSENEKEIIINFSKMNKILSIDKDNMFVEVECGVTLDEVKKFVDRNNFYFPLKMASSNSCLIGGNIATNAGGINALKYGTIRDSLQGIEVILADGLIIENMSIMKKNNTGYDIKNIFCGSEGTLGIISRALLKYIQNQLIIFIVFFHLDQQMKL